MAVTLGINGFGSIGRRLARQCLLDDDVRVGLINDLADAEDMAYLLQWDTTYGPLGREVEPGDGELHVGGRRLPTTSHRDPGDIPWGDHGVDVVVEATGVFRDADDARAHIDGGGADKVIISAPATGEDVTVVMGVNHRDYDPGAHDIVSNASCTTNCLAPVAKVLNDRFGLVRGLMTTVHAYTTSQAILDRRHPKDPRRGRAAGDNIVPTTTGAAVAVGEVLPELAGRLDGMAFRVPVSSVSVIDLVADLQSEVSAEAVNGAFDDAAAGDMAGILAVSREPLVSSDMTRNDHSSIVDAASTTVMDDDMVKVVSWYDNEWGYAARLKDLAAYMVSRAV